MAFKSVKIKTIFFIYWFLLLYIIAALIWWFIALNQQNDKMAEFKIHLISLKSTSNPNEIQHIKAEQQRKQGQYIGEGAIFFLLISAGALFLFRAVNKQLKLSRQQQDFMMAITHELKTPLAVTKLNLETLQKRKLDELQQKKLIDNTIQESSRMNALCNNLLLSSQMEGNGYHFTSENMNLSECVENSVSDFSLRFSNRNFEVEIDENVMVQADAFLLQMAINNLIDNAVKYSPKDTSIKIILEQSSQHCKLVVADEGPGIPDQDKFKVFEKYYRLGTAATQKSKGTGLGLFLVFRIIKAHKAKIFIENNLPQGSRFIIEMKKLV